MNLIKEPDKSIIVPVRIKHSLTDRFAVTFTQIAGLFTSTEIYLINPPIKVNAKSIIAVLNLHIQMSEVLFIEAQGYQASLAAAALVKALSDPNGENAVNILNNLKKEVLICRMTVV